MSAALDLRSTDAGAWSIGVPRLLAGLDTHAVLDHGAHLEVHGPQPIVELPRLVELLTGAGLSGRGGAGFPLAAKLQALHGQRARVIVNGSESEPASLKDRTLLRRAPHLVLDGALAVAAALGTDGVTVAVHDEAAFVAVSRAAAQRPDGRRVRLARTGGGFVGGEARALVRGLDGGPAVPPGRREHLTSSGTLVANVETFAQTAILLRRGLRGFTDTGTRDEPGTALVTVGGAVGRPGVVELPLGTPLGILLTAAQAAPAQAVLLGGYHGGWVRPNPDIRLSRAGAAAAGSSFGAGVVLVVDEATCGLGELALVSGWLARASAKQCGPCRFGLPALAADVAALAAGNPAALGAAFGHLHSIDGRGACSHPDGAVRFVSSGLHVLQDEVELHRHGGCRRPVVGRLPLTPVTSLTSGGAR
ncbi:NADH-ubiquinone oxidoreductase-F iron-sulfur binding region domain-containing protein [Jatrophihabitans sp.]|uniref:NADH-ubiquinone oxidoreductase-F iron-sulfur binding region domain-containing protein n=1 Tax=Jatrophihabitans sp. TaxID=1932789 RepID=UPI0030C7661F|nr:NADH:ubiquinone oxidoreductase, NADH-binding subunit [Jatrophihabitans sp.]